MNKYVIGIDTGGTFTDGVLLQYRTRKVISTAKSLTTKWDLKDGVIDVLRKLKINSDYDIRLVGISSTLATNSIAEGKARRVGLILIGYDKELIEEYGLDKKLGTEKIAFIKGGHNAQGVEKEPLDEESIKKWVLKNQKSFDAIAVSSYFSPLNPDHEDKAFESIKEVSGLPIVMGHQLSTKLDSVKRAATASINASLVAVMQDFIESVRTSLKNLGIKAPLMIVRGNGTLMPYKEAIQKPVETVLSGPAASAIGGRFLSDKGTSLVIDVGSTTTDMALVEDARVVVTEEGAMVGQTETAVEAARIRTISLGCDSHLSFDQHKNIQVGPDKVTPVSQLAMRYKNVAEELDGLKNHTNNGYKATDTEFWLLYHPLDKSIADNLSPIQQEVIELIKDGPCNLSKIIEKTGVYHATHLKMDGLIKQGYIEMSTLTPTDLLHVLGDMNIWDNAAAKNALEHFCKIPGLSASKFINKTMDIILSTMVEEIIIFLACQDIRKTKMPLNIDGVWGKWLLRETLKERNDYISVNLDSKVSIIGTGAPAEFFIKRASEHVRAHFILPEHYNVANAVGAVSGSLMETREARVFSQQTEEKHYHVVQFEEEKEYFDDYDEACSFAEKKIKKIAKKAAVKAGAENPYVELKEKREGSFRRYIARAVGNPKLSARQKQEKVEKQLS